MSSINRLGAAILTASLIIVPLAGAHAHQSGSGMTPGSGPNAGMMNNMPQSGNMGPGMGGSTLGGSDMMEGHGNFDPRLMGPGMMGSGMMGSNMMSMMHGSMSGHGMMASRTRPFTGQEIRRIVDGRLAVHGLSRLKVGTVEAADDTTYAVDIVTLDDSLAVRLTIEKQSGRVMNVE